MSIFQEIVRPPNPGGVTFTPSGNLIPDGGFAAGEALCRHLFLHEQRSDG